MKFPLLRAFTKLFWRIDNRFLRFLFVGALNTIVGYGFFLFFIWIGLPRALSLLFSNIFGVAFNYKTTGVLVFQNKDNNLMLRFFAVYAFVYLINLAELWLLANSGLYSAILDWHLLDFIDDMPLSEAKIGEAIGQAIVVLPNAVITFLLSRRFVFRSNKL
ncbi:MAG: GtrA family protein [Bacteroidales bacterium]|jgi:putative flippase GtrA|nr:GtrA family protein [Bacteroidales bacterium]